MTNSLFTHEFHGWAIVAGWTLLHFVWQGFVIAFVLAAILHLCRNSPSRLRYNISCIALAVMVVIPLVTYISLPSSLIEISGVRLLPFTDATLENSGPLDIGGVDSDSLSRVSSGSWMGYVNRIVTPFLPAVTYLWLASVFCFSLWRLGAWNQMQQLKMRRVQSIDPKWRTWIGRASEKLGIQKKLRILQSSIVDVPVVIGWLKPVLLVPASALAGLKPELLEAVLLHELAHIRRHDFLVNVLQTCVETMGFYHPAVWWISGRIRIERENCCDDIAVGTLQDPVRYANALAQLEELRFNPVQMAMAANGGSLLYRIQRILGAEPKDYKYASWPVGLSVLVCMIGLAVSSSNALNRPLEQIRDEPWCDLFDRQTLDGWVQRGGNGRIYVEKDTIVTESGNTREATFLCTEKEYGDFLLEFDVNIDSYLNAGVQFRSQIYKEGDVYFDEKTHRERAFKAGRVYGYQVEIDPSKRSWSGGIYDEARRGWLTFFDDNHQALTAFKPGQWNRFQVLAIGDSIRTRVNGIPCAQLNDSVNPRGFIALQAYNIQGGQSGKVLWRNIRIKEITIQPE